MEISKREEDVKKLDEEIRFASIMKYLSLLLIPFIINITTSMNNWFLIITVPCGMFGLMTLLTAPSEIKRNNKKRKEHISKIESYKREIELYKKEIGEI